MVIPLLRVHEMFLLALDQFKKLLDDQSDPRAQMGYGKSLAGREYLTAPDKDQAPPSAPVVRCSDVGRAELFGTIMYDMEPTQARAVRYHFMISSFVVVNDEWQKVVTTEARYFKLPVLEYVELIQRGIDHITEKL